MTLVNWNGYWHGEELFTNDVWNWTLTRVWMDSSILLLDTWLYSTVNTTSQFRVSQVLCIAPFTMREYHVFIHFVLKLLNRYKIMFTFSMIGHHSIPANFIHIFIILIHVCNAFANDSLPETYQLWNNQTSETSKWTIGFF